MNLCPDEILKKFEEHPLCSQETKGEDAECIVKYFNPFGRGTWLITEAEQQDDGTWLLFGLCHIHEWEWGYVELSELEQLGFIERDIYIGDHPTVKELRQ